MIAVTPMPIPMIADSNGRPAAISEPKVISRTTAATPMPITSVRLCLVLRLHGVAAVLDGQAGGASRLDRGRPRPPAPRGVDLRAVTLYVDLGVAGAAVGGDRLGGEGIENRRPPAEPSVIRPRVCCDLCGVRRVGELLAGGRLEHDPGGGAVGAGLREPLLEQVDRPLRLGARDREAVGGRAGQGGRAGDAGGQQPQPDERAPAGVGGTRTGRAGRGRWPCCDRSGQARRPRLPASGLLDVPRTP